MSYYNWNVTKMKYLINLEDGVKYTKPKDILLLECDVTDGFIAQRDNQKRYPLRVLNGDTFSSEERTNYKNVPLYRVSNSIGKIKFQNMLFLTQIETKDEFGRKPLNLLDIQVEFDVMYHDRAKKSELTFQITVEEYIELCQLNGMPNDNMEIEGNFGIIIKGNNYRLINTDSELYKRTINKGKEVYSKNDE